MAMKKGRVFFVSIISGFFLALFLLAHVASAQIPPIPPTVGPTLAPTVAPTVGPSLPPVAPPAAVGASAVPTPEPCKSARGDARSYCPKVEGKNYVCASSYEEWLKDKRQNFWVDDPEITALGKGGERSRQFLYWVLTHPSDDDSPVILQIWSLSRNIAYFLLLIIAIFMGIGIIVGQRNNFDLKVEVSPLIIKLLLLLLYVTFSATIILLLVQIADILMEFFIRTLGVKELFNIFFVPGGDVTGNVFKDSETAYQTFQGCSNLKSDALESVRTSRFLIRFTNMTYYFIGIMLLLRKIVLWFLLIVAPFLAILAPFIFIRNIGWIWIGVFFQWLFYGPLMSLFLGALAKIWNNSRHIPFIFDFSRIPGMRDDAAKMIYPTTTNILYGGPAQKLELYNTSSYVDTFAEYIIALIMLWTVIILPWWLLRIFRDYCCEGIMATKNVLIAMYDSFKSGGFPPAGPAPTAPTPTSTSSTALKLPKQTEIKTTMKLETIQEIKHARTEEITKSINIQVSKLTDIARVETNKETRENVVRNMDYLSNPMRAQTPTERQKFMTMRTELYERANKGDKMAQQAVNVFSASRVSQVTEKERLLKTVPQAVAVIKTTSIKVGLPQDKTARVVNSVFNTISANDEAVSTISSQSNISKQQVQSVLTSLTKVENSNLSAQNLVTNISNQTRVEKVKVEQILRETANLFKSEDLKTSIINNIARSFNVPAEKINVVVVSLGSQVDLSNPTPQTIDALSKKTNIDQVKLTAVIASTVSAYKFRQQMAEKIAQQEGIKSDVVKQVVATHLPVIAEPISHIEDSVVIPPTVSIEDYEEVKNMWTDQYEKGEVPISATIANRKEWIETDVLAITNILNKILSADANLKSQGLDEIGYILPIFMVNNLKGEELAVYLKAKLEAAKQIKKDIEKEEALKLQAQGAQTEEFVEIGVPKAAEAQKALHMEAALQQEIPKEQTTEEKAAQSRVKESVAESQAGGKTTPGMTAEQQPTTKIDEIKERLNQTNKKSEKSD